MVIKLFTWQTKTSPLATEITWFALQLGDQIMLCYSSLLYPKFKVEIERSMATYA